MRVTHDVGVVVMGKEMDVVDLVRGVDEFLRGLEDAFLWILMEVMEVMVMMMVLSMVIMMMREMVMIMCFGKSYRKFFWHRG